MEMGLEQKEKILEWTQNERQIPRNSEGYREIKIEMEIRYLETLL